MNTSVNNQVALDPVLGAEITHLLAECAAVLDEDRLEEWPELFVADARYRVLSLENEARGLTAPIIYLYSQGMLKDRVTALRDALTYEFVYTRHVTSPPRWSLGADGSIHVKSNFVVFQTTEEGVTRTFAVGQYRDELTRQDGSLCFVSRDVILDTFGVPNNIAVPL